MTEPSFPSTRRADEPEWIREIEVACDRDPAPLAIGLQIHEVRELIAGYRLSREPLPQLSLKAVSAICHAVSNNCVMHDDPERDACNVSNCCAMQAAARAATEQQVHSSPPESPSTSTGGA